MEVTVLFTILVILLGWLFAIIAPRAYHVFELLILAPIIGVAFGGFAWAIAAMFCSALITWAAFSTFLAGGTLLTGFIILRSR